MSILSRLLGVLCGLLALRSAYEAFIERSLSISWVLLVLWTLFLVSSAIFGWKKIPVGWKAELLGLGTRIPIIIVKEGWRWSLWPFFSFKQADCLEQIMELEPLDALTSDDILVRVKGTITWFVHDLDTYFGVEVAGLRKGIDDIRAQIIRTRVRELPLEKSASSEMGVLDSHAEIGTKLQRELSTNSARWGVQIPRVNISEIIPVDSKVLDDLSLPKREILQRTGQQNEADFIGSLTAFFQTEKGGKMNPASAENAALLVVGKADPKKINEINISPEVLAAAAKLLGRG